MEAKRKVFAHFVLSQAPKGEEAKEKQQNNQEEELPQNKRSYLIIHKYIGGNENMKMIQKKFWYLLLCAATVLALLPFSTCRASAASSVNPTVLRRQLVDKYGMTGAGQNWVYFGNYDGSPIKWRVLSTDKNGDSFLNSLDYAYTGSGLFLMSEALLGSSAFGSSDGRGIYQGSTLQGACGSVYESSFSDIEKKVVLRTTKADLAETMLDSPYDYGTSSLNGDCLFPLSATEAMDSAYGFSSSGLNDSARSMNTDWWLRSPDTLVLAGTVLSHGRMYVDIPTNVLGIRPAFNLNLSSTYLASAAVGGKSSGAEGPDALAQVATGTPTEWKLTLPDSDRWTFKASATGTTTVAPGSKLSVAYSGASTGPKEYVSAILEDGNLNMIYYGRIKNVTTADDASGSLNITVPSGLAEGSYDLMVFSEQYNGDYETDYASPLRSISLTVDSTAPTIKTVTPSGYGATADGSITVTFSESMNTTAGTVSLDSSATSLTGGAWSVSNTVYTVPYSGLSYSTEYTMTISGFQDAVGNGMDNDGTTQAFTTMDEPGSIGTITGIVTDDDGSGPISGADVSLMVGECEYYTETAADGSFTIEGVPAGWGYTVYAYKSGYMEDGICDVRVAPDTTTSGVNISLVSEEKGCLVTYRGAQKRYNSDSGTYDIRFIATINTLNADKVGFVLSKSDMVPSIGYGVDIETTYVYTSITAMGSTVTAESLGGTYIIAVTVTGIPASDIDTTLYVRAYSVVDSVIKYTPVVTVTVNNLS